MKFVIDENNNRYEALDKEGVLSVLEQAIENGSLAEIVSDSAFITKLKCCVSGITNKVAFVSQAKYNELEASGILEANAMYFIIDDSTCEDMTEELTILENTLNEHKETTQKEIDRFDSYFTNGKANMAVQTSFSDNDVSDYSQSGSGSKTYTGYSTLQNTCHFWWKDDNGNIYDLGIVKPATTIPSGMSYVITHSQSATMQEFVDGGTYADYNRIWIIEVQIKLTQTTPQFKQELSVKKISLTTYNSESVVSAIVKDTEEYAGGTLYWRPIY